MKACLLATALLTLPASAWAMDPPPPEVAAAMKVRTTMIVHGEDVKPLTVFEWERDGVQHNAWPGGSVQAPYDAAKVTLKLFNFPTGQLRKLYFGPGQKTPPHFNHDDIILYSLGTSQMEVVGADTFVSHPGDASLHPTGVTHYSQTIVPGWRCEFAFKTQGKSGLDPISISGRDKALHQASEWVENGHRMIAYDTPAAPGSHYGVRMFQFPGYQLLEEHLPKGETLPRHTASDDRLLYVVSGRLRVTSGSETGIVREGDMVRQGAGQPFAREALEDSVVVDVEASQTPG